MKKNNWFEDFKHKLIVYFFSLLIVAVVIAAGFGIFRFVQNKNQNEGMELSTAKVAMSEDEINALYKEHKTKEAETEVSTEEISETVESTEDVIEEEYVCDIDFEGLWEVNKDVYAWITVPGTMIDYPILQHPQDNSHYLHYNIDGSYGYPGCVFTENYNSKDFTDPNTAIYGHNMKNGSMFASLHKFEDAEFFEENQDVYIYTPEKEFHYTIFAAYIYDDRHLLLSYDFDNKDVYGAYLDSVFDIRDLNAHFREGVEVTADDKIITLVTCISKQPSKRLLVQAVLNQ